MSASEREARLLRAAGGRRAAERDAKPRRTAMRTRPVRTTVDLAPEMHRELKRWLVRAAAELDVVEVPLAEVFRVLIRRLVLDAEWEKQTHADLRDGMQ